MALATQARAWRSGFAMLALGTVLSGCVSAAPIPMAVLDYSAPNCAATPDLSGAISLLPEKDRQVWTLNNELDSASPCLELEGSQAPYLVYEIPEGGWNAPIEIGAVLGLARVASPHVAMLDAEGQVLRNFEPEDYHVRASIYSVLLQPLEGERYVLVSINPLRIGDAYEGIRTGTQVTTYWTGFGAGNWVSGLESMISTQFSYEGTIRANVYRQPKEEDQDD